MKHDDKHFLPITGRLTTISEQMLCANARRGFIVKVWTQQFNKHAIYTTWSHNRGWVAYDLQTAECGTSCIVDIT